MRGVFDDDPLQLAAPRRDAELTLGMGALLAIFLGLVLLCGLCFGLGYEFGRRSAPTTANLPSETAPVQTGESKPSAGASLTGQTANASIDQSSGPDANAAVEESAPADESSPDNPAQHPPVPVASGAAHPSVRADVRPIPPVVSTSAVVVQVASLADPNDAEYLLEALKKRGYPAMARREVGNHNINVRVGPFASRDEANRWRQRLMGDGYNATVLP